MKKLRCGCTCGVCGGSKCMDERHVMKKLRKCLIVAAIVFFVLAVGYQQLSDSQKRFVQELLRQSPYLIPRYFV